MTLFLCLKFNRYPVYTIPNNIHISWNKFFEQEFKKPYISQLMQFLEQEKQSETVIYPQETHWFRVFEKSLDDIKVIIIGQDPYFNEGQAMGLSFSVPNDQKIPPSLRNIYKELASDLSQPSCEHGDLSRWFEQESIFLLNASLTVEAGHAGSHLKKGWQQFTKAVIEHINQHCNRCVFLAWGAFAHKCCERINESTHCVIKTSHPSPLGAYKQMKTAPAFLGSQCFSQANTYLKQQGRTVVNWSVD